MEQARQEFLFVCPGENLRSLCFPFISGFPPPTASSPPPPSTPPPLRPLCSFFLITRSHEAPLPPRASPWPVALRDFAGTNTPCVIPATRPLPSRASASPRAVCHLIFLSYPGRQLLDHILHLLSDIYFVSRHLFSLFPLQRHLVSTLVCSAPSLCPGAGY